MSKKTRPHGVLPVVPPSAPGAPPPRLPDQDEEAAWPGPAARRHPLAAHSWALIPVWVGAVCAAHKLGIYTQIPGIAGNELMWGVGAAGIFLLGMVVWRLTAASWRLAVVGLVLAALVTVTFALEAKAGPKVVVEGLWWALFSGVLDAIF